MKKLLTYLPTYLLTLTLICPVAVKPAAAMTPEELAAELAASGLDRDTLIYEVPQVRPERPNYSNQKDFDTAYQAYRTLLKQVRAKFPQAFDQNFLTQQKKAVDAATTAEQLEALRTKIEEDKNCYKTIQTALGKLLKAINKKIELIKKEEEKQSLAQGAATRKEGLAATPAQVNVIRVVMQLLDTQFNMENNEFDKFDSEAFCPVHGLLDESDHTQHFFNIWDINGFAKKRENVTPEQRKFMTIARLQKKTNAAKAYTFTPEELELKKQRVLALNIDAAIADYRPTAPAEERQFFLSQGIDIDTMNRNDVKNALDYILGHQWICRTEKS